MKCSCGKICKNLMGLRRHQGKSKCGTGETQVQCTDLVSGETQESSSQEASHSTGDFLAPTPPIVRKNILTDAIPQTEPMKERIKWPKMSDTKEWNSLDNDLDIVLEATQAGTAERKVITLTEITYNLAK